MKEGHASEPDKAYLKTVSNPRQIHDHPWNQSPAKALYSFPHAERFPNRGFLSPCGVAYYDIPEDAFRSKRVCSLGVGNKFDFTKNAKNVPAPNNYYPQNLAIGFEKKKGFSFGLSREAVKQSGLTALMRSASQNPGPGTYTPQPVKSHKTVTLRSRVKMPGNDNNRLGPGNYEVISAFQPSKVIFNSKFRSTKSTKFAPLRDLVDQKTQRDKENIKTEGDEANKSADYVEMVVDTKYQINKSGVFFNSKYKNSMCRTFGKGSRDSTSKSGQPPGPGNYVAPSEFGMYPSSKFKSKE